MLKREKYQNISFSEVNALNVGAAINCACVQMQLNQPWMIYRVEHVIEIVTLGSIQVRLMKSCRADAVMPHVDFIFITM